MTVSSIPCYPLTGLVCQVCLSRERSAPVNDRPRVWSVFNPANEAVNIRDFGDLKILVFHRIEVDVEAVQPWVLRREHAFAKQCECGNRPSLKPQVFEPP